MHLVPSWQANSSEEQERDVCAPTTNFEQMDRRRTRRKKFRRESDLTKWYNFRNIEFYVWIDVELLCKQDLKDFYNEPQNYLRCLLYNPNLGAIITQRQTRGSEMSEIEIAFLLWNKQLNTLPFNFTSRRENKQEQCSIVHCCCIRNCTIFVLTFFSFF